MKAKIYLVKDNIFESSWPTRSKISLLNGNLEVELFHELCNKYKGYLIAPQVSFSALVPNGRMIQILKSILKTKNFSQIKKKINYISKSRVDFVIYDRKGYIHAVIEMNGGSHKHGQRRKKDVLKARILKEVGIKLIVYGIYNHLLDEFKER